MVILAAEKIRSEAPSRVGKQPCSRIFSNFTSGCVEAGGGGGGEPGGGVKILSSFTSMMSLCSSLSRSGPGSLLLAE